jgi:hypothetical protein
MAFGALLGETRLLLLLGRPTRNISAEDGEETLLSGLPRERCKASGIVA